MTDNATLPLFPLGSVLFPGAQMPIHIFEERYRSLMRDHLNDDPIFGVILTETGAEVGDEPEIHRVGTAAHLLAASELADGRWAIVIEGTRRFEVLSSSWDRGYLVAEIRWFDEADGLKEPQAAAITLIESFVAYLTAVGADLADETSIAGIDAGLRSVFSDNLDHLTYVIASQLPLNTWHHQRLLEQVSLSERYTRVRDLLRQERALLGTTGATTFLTSQPTTRILPN